PMKKLKMGNYGNISFYGRHRFAKTHCSGKLSQYTNHNVCVKDQRMYRGFRIFLSQASTSFMSSRSAHIPMALYSESFLSFLELRETSLATGLPRKVTVAVPTCCTFFNTCEVLSLSSFAVTTIGCHPSREVYTSKYTL